MMGALHSTKQTVFTPLCLLTGLTITCSLPFNSPAMPLGGGYAIAQIIPDNSLGSESSVVVPNVNINGINSDRIDGGAIRGSNLFHSFQEFNIDNGRGAYFTNPGNISNILTRVTGNNLSNILGTLGVLGNVNLFLINPNGIVFGPNARLDVGGSFFASTADSILFENGVEFAASNPDAPPLLTINIPIGLNFRENPGSIVNQSIAVDNEDNFVGLQVLPEKTLGLVGGDIQLETSVLTASQGRIELGSVAGNNTVSLTPIDKGYALGYENVQNFQDISLALGIINVQGEGGGDLQVQGRRVTLTDGSVLVASTQGSEIGGLLRIQASESVEVINSGISADVNPDATGTGGNIIIDSQNLLVRDGAFISTGTFGNGNGGNLTVTVTDIELVESILATSVELGAAGNAGDLTINTHNLSVRDGAQISASTFGNGNGGNLTVTAKNIELIGTSASGQLPSGLRASVSPEATGNGRNLTINTQRLLVRDGAQISASTFGNGNGSDLTVTATDIELIGTGSGFFTSVEPGALGKGGNSTVNTQRLQLQNGAQIGTGTFGNGNGGNLTVTATDIELVGRSVDGKFPSGLGSSVNSGAIGNGGTLTINTERLLVRDGAEVSASTFGQGDGGKLTITATDVELIGNFADGLLPSGLFAQVNQGAVGKGGSLTLNTRHLLVQNGAQIGTGTFGQGDGGNLTVNATDVELIGNFADGLLPSGLFASAEPESTGRGGRLTVNADNLIIQDGATLRVRSVSTEAAGDLIINAPNIFLDNQATLNADTTAGEGDIILNTSDLRLRNNSNITTNATGEATGGNITINTETLTALENSDISANAEAAFGGRIIINADGVFGTAFRDQQTRFSDITATSELGPEFSGTVELNTELDPSSGLIDLTQTVVDPNDLIAAEFCRQRGASQFIVTGKGGLAADPNDKADGNQIEVDLVEPVPSQPRNSSQRRSQTEDNQPISSVTPSVLPGASSRGAEGLDIIPARGWIRDENGDVILVSYDPTKTGVQRQPAQLPQCQP